MFLKGVSAMPLVNTFGVVGGDERMCYLAASIAKDGYPVCVAGLEKLPPCHGAAAVTLQELIERSSVVVLPLPVTRDGKTLNAPYSESMIELDASLAEQLKNRTVYGGMLQKLTASSKVWQELGPEDYYRREELAVGNAIPTAEAAVGIAISEPVMRLLGNQGRLVPQAGAPRARLRGGGDAGPPVGPAPGPGVSGSREHSARRSSSFQPTACTLLVLQGQARHGPPGVPAP